MPQAPETPRENRCRFDGDASGRRIYAYAGNDPINFVDRLGLNPGDLFNTPQAAAYDALNYINPVSIHTNTEYAGVVSRDPITGMYYASQPNSGSATNAFVGVNASGNDVGLYHTHGDYAVEDEYGNAIATGNPALDEYNSDNFSEADLAIINYFNGMNPAFTGYLGTPSGQFLQYNPSSNPAISHCSGQ